jgi:hypothetical protein
MHTRKVEGDLGGSEGQRQSERPTHLRRFKVAVYLDIILHEEEEKCSRFWKLPHSCGF